MPQPGSTNTFDVIVLGGGAAGLMCALVAGGRGRSVLVLEGSNKVGKKILMSGGGRCNFTNLQTRPEHFLSANPHFCKSALSRYTPWDFTALVDAHGIAYHEKAAGQLFCDRSSRDILNLLLAECERAAVQIQTHSTITQVTCNGTYQVVANERHYQSSALVLATGGLSIPKMGASDFGYRLARQFGLNTLPTRAGLVPFTLTGQVHELARELSGVSVAAEVQAGPAIFADQLLFTHRGLSGPAALQASSYWTPGESIRVNLLPATNILEDLVQARSDHPQALLRTALSAWMPKSLATRFQEMSWPQLNELYLSQISNQQLTQVAQQLGQWSLKPSGTEGYRTAEVTLGGIDTAELSSQTMESQRQSGLYCIGEVVDVTGHLGGFNFQWAWASAQAAGRAI